MTLNDQLLRRVLLDGETGLSNGTSLRLEARRAAVRAERYGFPLGMVTLRCDAWDREALIDLARRLSMRVRRSDLLARTGEREIRLLLTHEDAANAPLIAERLHAECRESPGAAEIRSEVHTDLAGEDLDRMVAEF